MYIQITNTELPTFWYANKIGYVFKVDEKISWNDNYTVKSPKYGPFRLVGKDDCKKYKPTLTERILIWLNIYN
jgi:hypothetical protein